MKLTTKHQTNRESLYKILSVSAMGLSKRELLEQSDCFVFTEDSLITFNGEVLTRVSNPLPEIQGAVPADDLMKLLAKFPDEELSIKVRGDGLLIKAGKRRAAGLKRAAEVALPFDGVPQPTKWKEAPEVLLGVLQQAAQICGKDETQPRTTEVHVTKDLVEACDNFRMFRYTMESTGLTKDALIPASSLELLRTLSPTHVSQRGGWLHFKTDTDHEVSVRCSVGDYPDLGPLLDVQDLRNVRLPANLRDILKRAQVMYENTYDNMIHVTIEKGTLTLKASKETGWYRESKKVSYKGPPIKFEVHPKFLEDILEKTRKVQIGGNRLKLESGNAVFVVCLEVEDE